MKTSEEVLFEIKFKNLTDIEKQQIRDGIISYSFSEIVLAMEQYKQVSVEPEVKPACDVADIKIKAKIMENKYWLNFLTLDATNIIHKSSLCDRIKELEKIENENRKSV